MDVPADVLQILKCSRCETYLSRGPVYLQHDGAAACGAVMPGLLYRGEDGWRCERCAPARRACENQAQGCTHTDIDTITKCRKHELFFCQQRTACFICSEDVSRGSLSAHYGSAHVTYRAGSTWRATQTDLFGQGCLVSSVAGTAVCWYGRDDYSFDLDVHIPVSSERLSEFRCTVRLTHRDTGHTHTCTPGACYTEDYDWCIRAKREEFPPWRDEFDVCVDIARAGTE